MNLAATGNHSHSHLPSPHMNDANTHVQSTQGFLREILEAKTDESKFQHLDQLLAFIAESTIPTYDLSLLYHEISLIFMKLSSPNWLETIKFAKLASDLLTNWWRPYLTQSIAYFELGNTTASILHFMKCSKSINPTDEKSFLELNQMFFPIFRTIYQVSETLVELKRINQLQSSIYSQVGSPISDDLDLQSLQELNSVSISHEAAAVSDEDIEAHKKKWNFASHILMLLERASTHEKSDKSGPYMLVPFKRQLLEADLKGDLMAHRILKTLHHMGIAEFHANKNNVGPSLQHAAAGLRIEKSWYGLTQRILNMMQVPGSSSQTPSVNLMIVSTAGFHQMEKLMGCIQHGMLSHPQEWYFYFLRSEIHAHEMYWQKALSDIEIARSLYFQQHNQQIKQNKVASTQNIASWNQHQPLQQQHHSQQQHQKQNGNHTRGSAHSNSSSKSEQLELDFNPNFLLDSMCGCLFHMKESRIQYCLNSCMNFLISTQKTHPSHLRTLYIFIYCLSTFASSASSTSLQQFAQELYEFSDQVHERQMPWDAPLFASANVTFKTAIQNQFQSPSSQLPSATSSPSFFTIEEGRINFMKQKRFFQDTKRTTILTTFYETLVLCSKNRLDLTKLSRFSPPDFSNHRSLTDLTPEQKLSVMLPLTIPSIYKVDEREWSSHYLTCYSISFPHFKSNRVEIVVSDIYSTVSKLAAILNWPLCEICQQKSIFSGRAHNNIVASYCSSCPHLIQSLRPFSKITMFQPTIQHGRITVDYSQVLIENATGNLCAVCGSSEVTIVCDKCHVDCYCSAECQRFSTKNLNHASWCYVTDHFNKGNFERPIVPRGSDASPVNIGSITPVD